MATQPEQCPFFLLCSIFSLDVFSSCPCWINDNYKHENLHTSCNYCTFGINPPFPTHVVLDFVLLPSSLLSSVASFWSKALISSLDMASCIALKRVSLSFVEEAACSHMDWSFSDSPSLSVEPSSQNSLAAFVLSLFGKDSPLYKTR